MTIYLEVPEDIDRNQYSEFLIEQLRGLDPKEDTLDLVIPDNILLEEATAAINIIHAIPSHIKNLTLFYMNTFKYFTDEALIQLHEALGSKNFNSLYLFNYGDLWFENKPIEGSVKYRLVPRDIEVITQCVSASPHLKILDLSGSYIGKRNQKDFSILYASRPAADALDLSGGSYCNISEAAHTRRFVPSSSFCFSEMPPSMTTLYLNKNNLHKLSTQHFEELSGALPCISTLYVSGEEINKMSNAKLDAFAEILPNAIKVIAIAEDSNDLSSTSKQIETMNEADISITSDKIVRLQTKAGAQARAQAIHATIALSRLEKGIKQPSGKTSRLPLDIIKHTAEFLPMADEIKKGLHKLINEEKPSEKSEIKPPDFKK